MRLPRTKAEWQDAVDGAAGMRLIADCKMYGLIVGGPRINVERCDRLLQIGAARGITPSRDPTEIAIGMIAAIDEEAESNSDPDERKLEG